VVFINKENNLRKLQYTMAEIKKRKTRMYEPWGYQEENNYQSSETQFEIDLNELFASAAYNSNDKQIHFFNNDGKELSGSSIDTTQFSASVVEEAYYDIDTKELVIKFANGDEVRINMAEIVDENEFADGLQVDSGGVVSVLIDSEGENYLSVSDSGIKISGIDAAIDNEKTRAETAEETLNAKINDEITRANDAENILRDNINSEIIRATSKEDELDSKIVSEIHNRIVDVDAEETRAMGVEKTINDTIGDGFSTIATETVTAKFNKLSSDVTNEIAARTTQDNQLQNEINNEVVTRQQADLRLENLLTDERNRATATESQLNSKISTEEIRAKEAEANLKVLIDNEVERATSVENGIKETAIFSVEYNSDGKTIIFFNENGVLIDTIDATDFIKDGMVDNVKIENGYLVITFNTDAGKEEIKISLSDIFNPDNYYTKTEVDSFLNNKVDRVISGANGKALVFNESDGGGAKFEHNDGTYSFVGVNDAGNGGIDAQIYAIDKDTKSGSRIDISNGGIYYTVGNKLASERMVESNEIAVKGDVVGIVDKLYDKLGYKDNDTLQTTNEHEVAFGEWNVSSTSADASGQTVFSVGIGTSADDRKNAFEVRKDGSIWATVEGEYLDITKILGQLTHEVYDADTNGNH